MSVINDMLTALDARRATVPAGTATVSTAPGSIKSHRLQIMAVIGAAAVTATAFADWPVLLSSSAKSPQPVTMTETAAPLAPAPDVPSETASRAVDVAMAAPTATTPVARARRAVASAPLDSIAAPATAAPLTATAALTPSTTRTPVATAHVAPTAPALTGTAEKSPIPLSASQRAALAYRQAIDLGNSGHSSAAIDRALEAIRSDPDHAGARQLAAVLMFEAQRLDEAGALLRAGLDRTPQQPRLAFLLARLKAETGDSEGALALLPAGAALAGEAHGLRAAILARQGHYADALSAYEAALRQDPSNASWWLGLGIALEASNQLDLAKQALRRAHALGTLRPDVQTYIEQKLASLG